MRENLAARERLFGELLPWDHANYGIDDSWVRCQPYEQPVQAGGHVTVRVVFTNHSDGPRRAACRAVLPRAWNADSASWREAEIVAKREGEIRLEFDVPSSAAAGRCVVPIDIRYGDWDLPQFTEAIVVI